MESTSSSLELDAPAKVNLALRVIGKRDVGYHDLRMVSVRVSLYDKVRIGLSTEAGIRLRCPGVEEGRENLAYKAAEALLDRLDSTVGVEISIEKRIPVAAGLGGGSSDAASVLKGLNRLLGGPFTTEGLMEIGAPIGADVPFFLFEKGALVEGKGELLREIPGLARLRMVLVSPGFTVSTFSVYRDFDSMLTNVTQRFSILDLDEICRAKLGLKEVAASLHNDLERVTLRRHPVLAQVKQTFLDRGALGSLMSGSGPTIFGLFPDKRSALAAAELDWGRMGWTVFPVHSI